jgi:hypothetical protein
MKNILILSLISLLALVSCGPRKLFNVKKETAPRQGFTVKNDESYTLEQSFKTVPYNMAMVFLPRKESDITWPLKMESIDDGNKLTASTRIVATNAILSDKFDKLNLALEQEVSELKKSEIFTIPSNATKYIEFLAKYDLEEDFGDSCADLDADMVAEVNGVDPAIPEEATKIASTLAECNSLEEKKDEANPELIKLQKKIESLQTQININYQGRGDVIYKIQEAVDSSTADPINFIKIDDPALSRISFVDKFDNRSSLFQLKFCFNLMRAIEKGEECTNYYSRIESQDIYDIEEILTTKQLVAKTKRLKLEAKATNEEAATLDKSEEAIKLLEEAKKIESEVDKLARETKTLSQNAKSLLGMRSIFKRVDLEKNEKEYTSIEIYNQALSIALESKLERMLISKILDFEQVLLLKDKELLESDLIKEFLKNFKEDFIEREFGLVEVEVAVSNFLSANNKSETGEIRSTSVWNSIKAVYSAFDWDKASVNSDIAKVNYYTSSVDRTNSLDFVLHEKTREGQKTQNQYLFKLKKSPFFDEETGKTFGVRFQGDVFRYNDSEKRRIDDVNVASENDKDARNLYEQKGFFNVIFDY